MVGNVIKETVVMAISCEGHLKRVAQLSVYGMDSGTGKWLAIQASFLKELLIRWEECFQTNQENAFYR